VGEVVKFDPIVVGEGFRFDPDEMLEGIKGRGYATVCVLAEKEDGELEVFGNANAGETLILIERAKHQIVFGASDND